MTPTQAWWPLDPPENWGIDIRTLPAKVTPITRQDTTMSNDRFFIIHKASGAAYEYGSAAAMKEAWGAMDHAEQVQYVMRVVR